MDKYQKIVTTGCLMQNNKVLIVRRSDAETFLPGYYEMPGGKCDFGENPEESLKREFKEEVGLKIEATKPYRIFSYVSDEGKRHTVEIVYLVKDGEGEIQLGKNHVEYIWITKDEINKYRISDEIKISILKGFEEFSQM
ncbi:MAG: DNA mismatch repair protein MutT [Candidatus Magasanikbacteria bacterium CG10_big_fil_rev_8_21_14_0_10_36_32]|uniref:DNA mismatch repair protein MutT n=1 Tax=Candidatus Magasanikbacteria bacterium CG10_big_fil_rev_8_21_14_0_10_36_32 TaxID=1974646 RepID=A0A2M6W5J4_9BACT|nr:MAG: DNA mismatch repair protein MutT [Candidatus Magasanikbacteria bacterium CG10_big_fil_rev_8_21_14_0_10_36_32]